MITLSNLSLSFRHLEAKIDTNWGSSCREVCELQCFSGPHFQYPGRDGYQRNWSMSFFSSHVDCHDFNTSVLGDPLEYWGHSAPNRPGSRGIKVRFISDAARRNFQFQSPIWYPNRYFLWQDGTNVNIFRLTADYLLIYMPGLFMYFMYYPLVKYLQNQVQSCLHSSTLFRTKPSPPSSEFTVCMVSLTEHSAA